MLKINRHTQKHLANIFLLLILYFFATISYASCSDLSGTWKGVEKDRGELYSPAELPATISMIYHKGRVVGKFNDTQQRLGQYFFADCKSSHLSTVYFIPTKEDFNRDGYCTLSGIGTMGTELKINFYLQHSMIGTPFSLTFTKVFNAPYEPEISQQKRFLAHQFTPTFKSCMT